MPAAGALPHHGPSSAPSSSASSAAPSPVVMFTNLPTELTAKLTAMVKRMGGRVKEELHEMAACTHLVTDGKKRTLKLLMALADPGAVSVVTEQWVTQSAAAHRFLPTTTTSATDKTSTTTTTTPATTSPHPTTTTLGKKKRSSSAGLSQLLFQPDFRELERKYNFSYRSLHQAARDGDGLLAGYLVHW